MTNQKSIQYNRKIDWPSDERFKKFARLYSGKRMTNQKSIRYNRKIDWPNDERFKKFARLLADKVTIHLMNGGKIAPSNFSKPISDNCNCPLGVVINGYYPYMFFREGWEDWSFKELKSFIDGFDHERPTYGHTSYFELGKAYRIRFGY